MIKTITSFFQRVCRYYWHHTFYIIADPADNSVTLSRRLFRHMNVMKLDVAKVYVFTLAGTQRHAVTYAFALNPPIDTPTQLADIQFNSKFRTVGFESLCPTVNRILYDYALPSNVRVKLSVEPCSVNNITYYKILRPCHRS